MPDLPAYLVIPRFLELGALPDRRARRRGKVTATDADVTEMRRLHDQEGRRAKWIWLHFEERYSYSQVLTILKYRRRADDAK